MSPPDDNAAASFAPLRPPLVRIAYRMLGSVAEAEDMVQEAYIRWHKIDRDTVRDAEAFLARTVTRLCLDHLKSARVQRETYIGPWLPEPIVEIEEDDKDSVTMTLMLALERLSPLERAAFLLHDVFGLDFDEIAKAVDRDPAACRQLASRARRHVRAAQPRFPVSEERGRHIVAAFLEASRNGNVQGLRRLLADDAVVYAVVYADGGGKASASLNPIYGWEKITRFYEGLARKAGEPPSVRTLPCRIDGLPGFMLVDPTGVFQTTALAIEDDKIVAIYVMRNPDKLRHVHAFSAGAMRH